MAASAVVESTSLVGIQGRPQCVHFQGERIESSPRQIRQVFTICSESDEDNTPRAPNVELSRLEAAAGLVSLTSDWAGEADDTALHQLTDVRTDENDEADDDMVLVTNKATQTHGFHSTQQASSANHTSSSSLSHHNSHQVETTPGNADHLPEHSAEQRTSEVPTRNDDPIEKQASEAPTLKVEYVGKVWDAYINDFLLGSEHIDQAAIFDLATGRCIACSSEFAMTEVEFDYLDNALGCLKLAYKTGLRINGRLYKTILADGRRGLMAKAAVDQGGCSACRTRTLIIVALHDRGASGRMCNEELMRLGDFFWTKGL